MSVDAAVEAGNRCLDDRVDVPGAPLWHLGKVAAFDSKESLDLLQNSVDYLTCKAQATMDFTADEKEFMKEIFEALWWGGRYRGYKEAAILANHYVNGEGRPLPINSEVYTTSTIVKDTAAAMKLFIADRYSNRMPAPAIHSGDHAFLNSAFAKSLSPGGRNVQTQGYLLSNGALLTEQSNQRLKNADHRFYLNATTSRAGNRYTTKWRVESLYDFEPFDKADYVTEIPLTQGLKLKLPDGLSHYLTKIGVAKDFKYHAEWIETWS